LLDPLAERVPSYHFMRRIEGCMQPENSWCRRELITRIASLFAASTMALISCLAYVVATVITAVIAPLKLPFSLLHLIFDENPTLKDIHLEWPGITDFLRNAAKTAIFAITSIFTSFLGLFSPKAMLSAHTYFEKVILLSS